MAAERHARVPDAALPMGGACWVAIPSSYSRVGELGAHPAVDPVVLLRECKRIPEGCRSRSTRRRSARRGARSATPVARARGCPRWEIGPLTGRASDPYGRAWARGRMAATGAISAAAPLLATASRSPTARGREDRGRDHPGAGRRQDPKNEEFQRSALPDPLGNRATGLSASPHRPP